MVWTLENYSTGSSSVEPAGSDGLEVGCVSPGLWIVLEFRKDEKNCEGQSAMAGVRPPPVKVLS